MPRPSKCVLIRRANLTKLQEKRKRIKQLLYEDRKVLGINHELLQASERLLKQVEFLQNELRKEKSKNADLKQDIARLTQPERNLNQVEIKIEELEEERKPEIK
uniref:Uncharacterized protein n=1 Tax=Caenorhabditis japonica TaxID=281687 RepID=A0A8R1IZA5_CAEJA